MAWKKPERVTVRTYQVGFGDCFLLSFGYASGGDRHVLIDFGSTSRSPDSSSDQMLHVAEDIRDTVTTNDGRLVAVVATHRHRDHISGFDGRTGEIIASLNPDFVLQPWTEHPDAEIDARKAESIEVRNLTRLHTLANMETIAARSGRVARQLKSHDRRRAGQLGFIGEDNVKNRDAVENLMTMGTNRYLREGNTAGLGRVLPGVKVHVLGPPSLTQTEAIEHQTHTNEDEFWQMQAGTSELASGERGRLFPEAATAALPSHARWFTRRLKDLRLDQMLELVLELDHALNNTSLILLFEIRDSFFLFSGDAQWENWEHALGKEKYRKLLKKVHLYKVGHHGSRNATPKTLWEMFQHKATGATPDRLTTLMSTMDGKHGSVARRTEVPRETLVSELETRSDLLDTRDLAPDEICHQVTYEFG